ncbi:MAG: hypothetical protein ACLFQX_00885 [Candidatus Kapaibacterium sp.]
MFLKIINYTVRGMIVVIGILLVSGVLMPEGADDTLIRVMGVIFILFGAYRIAMFRSQQQRYLSYEEEEDEDEKN